jgi:acetolactate synthase-1/2/3 large subunit
MKIHGGEMFARMLDREGVKNIFGLHGGHIDPIFQAAYDHDIRIIDTRHEQAAGHMADAWARTTGEPGVAVVTAGPGVTDIVTAVANAHIDCVPMVVIGGRHPVSEEEQMPLQELHGLPIMESITKWSRLVRDPERLPEYVNMAFRQATTGRPGPVFLEVPADVLATKVEEDEVRFPEIFHPDSAAAPSAQAIEAAADMIAKAERPVIFAGRGVWFSQATEELREFSELANMPVCANGMTRGAVPEGSRLGLGSFMVAGRWLALAGNPDVVLLLGAREGMFTGGRKSIIPADAKVIHVDIAAEEMGRGRGADLGIVGDCKETLKGLTRELQGREIPARDEWLDRLGQAREAAKGMLAGTGKTSDRIHPFQLAQEVSSFVEEDGVLVADGGETFVWTELALEARRPGRYLGHGYLGCLGTGLPFGLAAKLAHPDERVLVMTGDGSVGLNFTEFDTAVRHNLPITVVVNNDAAWGMCKHEQQVAFGDDRVIGTDLDPTRYEKAAEAFNVHAEFVENAEQISPAIERAFASGRPACVNVMTDPAVISPAVQSGDLV